MRLEIQHFSKIKQASIKLDGITVIAGENNTGKSTVGKILSCMFNSMYKVDEKASQKKKEQIESLLRYTSQIFRTAENQKGNQHICFKNN